MAQHIPPLWVYECSTKYRVGFVEVEARSAADARSRGADAMGVLSLHVVVVPARPVGVA